MEETQFNKLDDTTLEVVKPIETVQTTTVTYDYDFLKSQEVSILKQKNDFIEARDTELLEVRNLLAKCEELGIKSKVETALQAELERETVVE